MVILIACNHFGTRKVVNGLCFFNEVDRKGESAYPGLAGFFIFQVELCGAGILNPGSGAHVIGHFNKKVGFYTACKIIIIML